MKNARHFFFATRFPGDFLIKTPTNVRRHTMGYLGRNGDKGQVMQIGHLDGAVDHRLLEPTNQRAQSTRIPQYCRPHLHPLAGLIVEFLTCVLADPRLSKYLRK